MNLPRISVHGQDTLPGISLGTTFQSHRAGFLSLSKQGFDEPPKNVDACCNFILEHTSECDKEAMALVFNYENGRLQKIEFIVSKQPSAADYPMDVLHGLKEQIIERLGPPTFILDRTAEFCAHHFSTHKPEHFIDMLWQTNVLGCSDKSTTIESATVFREILEHIGDARALCNIYTHLETVTASVTFI